MRGNQKRNQRVTNPGKAIRTKIKSRRTEEARRERQRRRGERDGRGEEQRRPHLKRKVSEYSTRKRTFRLNGAPSARNQSRNIPQMRKSTPIMMKPII